MADVSKLVRDRLAQAPAAGPHPDADLLNAFAEQALSTREREQVVAHLATCAGCREIVALAAPENAPALERPAAATRPRWLPWPVLRWGAVTVAVVLVAVVVLMQSPRWAPEEKKAAALARQDSQVKTLASPPASASSATPMAQAEPAAGPADHEQAAAGRGGSARAKLKEEKQTEVAGLSGLKTADRQRDERMTMDKISAAPAPPTVATAGAQPVQAPAKDQPASAAEAELIGESKPAAGAANNEVTMARSAPAAPPAAKKAQPSDYDLGKTDSYVGAVNGAVINGASARMQAAVYRWTVTSDGRVQRSPDGRNWYYVPIASTVHFRALTNDGPRVWAGGNNGALFYSADAGEKWQKVATEQLKGDIIRLMIYGTTLTITTSSGQVVEVHHDVWGMQESGKPPSPR